MLDEGHRLSIFARDHISRVHGNLVEAYGLRGRTRYLISDGKRAAARLAPLLLARVASTPAVTLRRARTAARWGAGVKSRVQHAVRAAVLPRRAPDLCLVHEHETLLMVPWLREVYPDSPVALYFHGGRPPKRAVSMRNGSVRP